MRGEQQPVVRAAAWQVLVVPQLQEVLTICSASARSLVLVSCERHLRSSKAESEVIR